MSDSDYNVYVNSQWGAREFKLLSVTKIKRYESCSERIYFVVRCQNYDNKHFYEYIIDVDGTHGCGYHSYDTHIYHPIARKLNYDTKSEPICKTDKKFIPQSFTPSNGDETWIIDRCTQMFIKHAVYNTEKTGNHGGYVTFTFRTEDMSDYGRPSKILWELKVESSHDGFYYNKVQMDSAKGDGSDRQYGPTFSI